MDDHLRTARAALDDALAAVERLDKLCCEPGRSPRMARLRETIESGAAVNAVDADAVERVATLVDAGGQVGSLQVECCTPARMKLYASVLDDLATAQMALNASVGRGH